MVDRDYFGKMEQHYLELMNFVIAAGWRKSDRTGVGTRSLFGERLRFDLSQGFPLLTTKYVSFKNVAEELRWFLSGSTNINDLDSSIWNEWADDDGQLGPIYGHQWRNLKVDQIDQLISGLQTDPHGRRHIVDSWNVEQICDMSLPPCHCLFQFYVDGEHRLHCQLYQRSADIFLGVPYNIASYSLLTHMIAEHLGFGVGTFTHVFGDVHLYENHMIQALEQLTRKPNLAPRIEFAGSSPMSPHGWSLVEYDHHAAIKAQVAV